jgi:hypothetical protein
MSERFLEEQLKRIREMTEQMTRLRNSAAELSEAFDRERISGYTNPLYEVRDLRTLSSEPPQRDTADEHATPGRHHSHSTRGRRK